MRFEIDGEKHKIIYIDYYENLPHSVITKHFIKTAKEPYWRLYSWDFFANNGDKKDIRAYNSGSGGEPNSLNAPKWIDGYVGKFWLSNEEKFIDEVENGKRLKNPIRIEDYFRKSTNPFKVSEITHNMEYCDRCGFSSTEFCYEHKYDDENGDARYIDDNSFAE